MIFSLFVVKMILRTIGKGKGNARRQCTKYERAIRERKRKREKHHTSMAMCQVETRDGAQHKHFSKSV